MAVQNPPEGYHTVTPYLTVAGAAEAIDFYAEAFGATELMRLPMGDKIGHAEIRIGDSFVMLADEMPEMNILGPNTRGGPTAALMLYLDDVDAAYQKAIDAGCTEGVAPADQFWGDRMGNVIDPFGHKWTLATHVRDVGHEEMAAAMKKFSEGAGG